MVLDVRWTLRPPPRNAKERKAAAREDPPGLVEHDAGHIPGAVYVDLDTELAGPPGPAGRHPLPDPDVLEETLQRAGAVDDSEIVVYDGGDGMASSRAWWVLRWAGIRPDRVAVLDGGWPAWVAAGGEVSTVGGGRAPPRHLRVDAGAMPVLTASGAADVAAARDAVLLDGRAAERFRGETEPIDPVAGHVPGAENLPAAVAHRRRRPLARRRRRGRGAAPAGRGGRGGRRLLRLRGERGDARARARARRPADARRIPPGSTSGAGHTGAATGRPVETGPGTVAT